MVLLAVTCLLQATMAQEPSQQQSDSSATIPRLQSVVADDFSVDSRSRYDVKGDVAWQPGTLTLHPGSSLQQEIESSAKAEIQLSIQLPALIDQTVVAELKIRMVLDRRSSLVLRIRRSVVEDRTLHQIAVLTSERTTRNGKPTERMVRDWLVNDQSLATVKVMFGYGLIGLELASGQTLWAFTDEYAESQVSSIRMEPAGAGVVLHRFAVSRLAVDNLSSDLNLTERQDRQVDRAAALVDEFQQSIEDGDAEAGIAKGERAYKLLKATLGQDSEMLAESLLDLAELYSEAGADKRAEQCGLEAVGISKRAAGQYSLLHASSLDAVARRYADQKDFDQAEEYHKRTVNILKQVVGEQHPFSANVVGRLGSLYARQGNFRQAEPLMQQALAMRTAVYGENSAECLGNIRKLAGLYEDRVDWERAETLLRQAAEIARVHFGEQDGEYATYLNRLALLHVNQRKFSEAETLYLQALEIRKHDPGDRHPDYATILNNLAVLCTHTGDYERAESLFRQALEIQEAAFGKEDSDYLVSLVNLAWMHDQKHDYSRAMETYQQVLEIQRSALGEQHPDYADTLQDIAMMQLDMGEYEQAESLCRQVLEIRRATSGGEHPAYAQSLSNLALVYEKMGDYSRAEPLYRQSLDITRTTVGDDHPTSATTMNNLALLYYWMSDYGRSEMLFRQAIAIQETRLGKLHPDYALSLNNLGLLYEGMGEYSRAERLYREALDVWKRAYGEEHRRYALTLHNLGLLYERLEDESRSEAAYLRALEIWRVVTGDQHPRFAATLGNLANLYDTMGAQAKAVPLHKQVLEIRGRALGNRHPDYGRALFNLACSYRSAAQDELAVALHREAAEIHREHLDENSVVQSERQQSRNQAEWRRTLDGRFSSALTGGVPAAAVLEDLWRWKGAVTARQRAYRSVASNPEVAPLFTQLQTVASRLSAQTHRRPLPPASEATVAVRSEFEREVAEWQAEFAGLTRQREELERQIAASSEEFRRIQEPVTVAAVQRSLPQRTAYVDFLEYSHGEPSTERPGRFSYEQRYLVFVVRPERDPVMLSLGPVESIEDAIAAFRRPLQSQLNTSRVLEAADAAGKYLRRELWLPIEEHLDDIETVILSPDTALGTLPFAALPGLSDDRFLIEQYRIALLPMVHQLGELTGSEPSTVPRNSGLLVVGNVDYDAELRLDGSSTPQDALLAGRARQREQAEALRETIALRSTGRESWGSLPGFQDEMQAVLEVFREQFRDVSADVLSGAAADEGRFLAAARRFGTLHIITHGYFENAGAKAISQTEIERSDQDSESESVDQFIDTYLPGLLSGLVLAGANNPSDDPGNPHDGILRASEIEAASLQGVDLVVLSACETGLGAVAGGEGLTGLQRAFQVAGARTVIASLWKVDDAATQALMTEFYRNLWDRKLGKLDALHQAQLKMIDSYDAKSGRLRGQITELPPIRVAKDRPKSLPPFYWAAFQLSGDWR